MRYTELLKQTGHIDELPVFDHFAAGHARDHDAGERHPLAGRRDAEEFTLVGAGRVPAADNGVTFGGNKEIGCLKEIREGRPVRRDELAEAGGPVNVRTAGT
jgi:hypothetical protein